MNKKEIAQLQSKLEQKDSMISYLTSLQDIRKKYEKLIDTDYQNGIQQKLSMIRGKVDDLKKKIKEINKDILSYEQEHSELID
jgi:flagellar biosynthesis/type III secretory pathway chaperone